MDNKNHIGLVGLAAMGAALATNFAHNGVEIAVYNRSEAKTDALLAKNIDGISGYKSLKEFVESLERPRKIIIMIKSGQPVDMFIEEVYPLLDNGDILIDCGNSNWKDTIRRQDQLADGKIYLINDVMEGAHRPKRLHFIGCGVSGGEEGALMGPSIMPGGSRDVLEEVLPYLEKVAAKDFTGKPCVTNVGESAAGHFVKMVHNGIEYAQMQGIAEIYDILRKSGQSQEDIQKTFAVLNSGYRESFLLSITEDILATNDAEQGYLLDKVQHVAGAKGTGRWTVEAAMELGIAAPSIAEAVFARVMSSNTNHFTLSGKDNAQPPQSPSTDDLVEAVNLLFESTYAQGLDIIAQAETEHQWGIDLQEVVRIWQGGCIIRSRMLESLFEKWTSGFDWNASLEATDRIINTASGVPLPVISSVSQYTKGLLTENYPTNLTQAQRDFFGAHTFKRNDKEGIFTGGWLRDKGAY